MDYTLFEAHPGISVALLADAPRFTIVAATNDFVRFSCVSREEATGRGLFELFPENPNDLNLTGNQSLIASFKHVLHHKKPHQLPKQRYDIRNADDAFTKKYWKAYNTPVLSSTGELLYIILRLEDVTESVLADERAVRLRDLEKSYRLFLTAPVVIGIVKGNAYKIELANDELLQIWGKSYDVIGRPLLEAVPELQGQGFIELLDEVRRTGKPYFATEAPIKLVRNGKEEQLYMNFVYKAFYEDTAAEMASGVIAIGHDVTEQVMARRKVEESTQELQLAVEIAELGTFRVDLLANKSYGSEKINEWFGFQEQVYSLESAFARIHPEDRDCVDKTIRNTLQCAENSRHDVTYRVIHPTEGAIRHLRSFGKTLFNDQGKPYLITGIIQDVTPQILHQRQLEESEAVLQKRVEEKTADLNNQKVFISSILDASLDGIYALEAVRNADGAITDFRYLFANKHIAKLLHMDVEQIIGSSMLRLLPENRNNGFFDLFCTLLQTGETFRDQSHFAAQGIDNWFDYVIAPIDRETLVVSIEDITEKKHSIKQIEEQRNLLDNILRNSSNGISVSKVFRDDDGKVIDALTILANDAAVKYIGLPRDVYLSKRATEIEPAIIGSPYYQACIKTLETGEPFVMQYHTESTNRWLELTVSRLDHDHLIQIFTDVTPIKEAQLQLEQSVEELKRSNQNLEQFAYAASHDLKEPMRKIQLFSERLKENLGDKLEKEDQHYFNRILHATHRMNALIDDLLMYSHVSRGAVREELVDLNKKVKLVLEDLELEIEEKNASVTVGPLPTIKGHRRQLQQLFQNLIGNAIKYNNPGTPPEVNISSRLVNSDKAPLPGQAEKGNQHYHLIEVRDNGIGFEPEDAERIFDVFTRLHGTVEYKGTGIGLAIVRKVVENHGGTIWAESRPGEGATFKILLPANQ